MAGYQREQGQEHQLSRGIGREQQAHRQTVALGEPAVGDSGRNADCAGTRTDPDEEPHVTNRCQGEVIKTERPDPAINIAIQMRIVRLRPMTSARPVRNGPTAPRSTMLIETAPEMVLTSQPEARCSGTMITPGAARTPTPAMVAVNMTASTIQA